MRREGKKMRIKIKCPHCEKEIDIKEFNYILAELSKVLE